MECIRTYLNSLDVSSQKAFAKRCGTSVGYIRKVLSIEGKRFGESLTIAFERESGGVIRCELVRPDVDWAFVRGSRCVPSASTTRSAV